MRERIPFMSCLSISRLIPRRENAFEANDVIEAEVWLHDAERLVSPCRPDCLLAHLTGRRARSINLRLLVAFLSAKIPPRAECVGAAGAIQRVRMLRQVR